MIWRLNRANIPSESIYYVGILVGLEAIVVTYYITYENPGSKNVLNTI